MSVSNDLLSHVDHVTECVYAASTHLRKQEGNITLCSLVTESTTILIQHYVHRVKTKQINKKRSLKHLMKI